jgi:ABC-type glycerol-3-phosphate transport system substrate-binding protein
MRRFFTWVFVVISLTLVVSAVGLAEQVELEVWFSDFNKNTQEWIAQDLVPAFEREHPNINPDFASAVGWSS